MTSNRASFVDAAALGWIKLYRAIRLHPIWEIEPQHFKVAISLLLLVNRRPGRVWNGRESVALDAGEVLASHDAIARASGGGITRDIVRRALENLGRIEFLDVRRSTVARPLPEGRTDAPWAGRGIVVGVRNWERYQGGDGDADARSPGSRPVLAQFSPNKQEVENERSSNRGSGSSSVPPEPPAVVPRILAAFLEEFDREPIDGERAVLADLGSFPDDAVRATFRETREKNLALTYARAVLRYNASAAAAGTSRGGRA